MQILFYTLGCKVNQYETQAMMKMMTEQGYEAGEYTLGTVLPDNSVIVINSCTVTGESDRKLRQLLRRCRRDNPHAVLVLTGCMPQAFPDVAERFTEADIVLGNAARKALPSHLHQFVTLGQRIVDVSQHSGTFESMEIDEFQGRTRAFVKIQDGCNRFCSYCIIPYARGRVRSKSLEELRHEVETLAQKGYREVVLVGINLTAYGQDLGFSLCDAVDITCAVENILRVRLGSLEPDMMSEEVVQRLALQPKLCPQFHLSLQSGCDATLRRMNRHYTTAEFREVCDRLRLAFPHCALTTDVMVGFPGETDEEFADSLHFVKEIGFSKVHVFPYSRRPGTPADKAPGQVPNSEKTERSHRMMEVCEQTRDAYLQSFIGKKQEVLLETRNDENGLSEGYTPNYLPIKVKTDHIAGETILVRINAVKNGCCFADEYTGE